MNVPDALGMPLMVMVLSAQAAVTPDGKPEGVPMPVATEVLCVILVNVVLIQTVGVLEAALAVTTSFTVIVPVAFTEPQAPVKGIE